MTAKRDDHRNGSELQAWGLDALGDRRGFTENYETARSNSVGYHLFWAVSSGQGLTCVITITSGGPEPDAAFKWVAIRQGRRKAKLSLMPVNRIKFDGIRSLIETYVAGRVADA